MIFVCTVHYLLTILTSLNKNVINNINNELFMMMSNSKNYNFKSLIFGSNNIRTHRILNFKRVMNIADNTCIIYTTYHKFRTMNNSLCISTKKNCYLFIYWSTMLRFREWKLIWNTKIAAGTKSLSPSWHATCWNGTARSIELNVIFFQPFVCAKRSSQINDLSWIHKRALGDTVQK